MGRFWDNIYFYRHIILTFIVLSWGIWWFRYIDEHHKKFTRIDNIDEFLIIVSKVKTDKDWVWLYPKADTLDYEYLMGGNFVLSKMTTLKNEKPPYRLFRNKGNDTIFLEKKGEIFYVVENDSLWRYLLHNNL